MDSYELYLLYHQDRYAFINLISAGSPEVLLALKVLLQNNKIQDDDDIRIMCDKVAELLKHGRTLNEIADEIFEALLTLEYVEKYIKTEIVTINQLRIVRTVVKKFIREDRIRHFLRDVSDEYIKSIYNESSSEHHHIMISILNQIISFGSTELRRSILESIYMMACDRTDRLSLINVCYFFDKILQCKVIPDANLCAVLEKYFKSNEPTAKKQGVFLIKTMVLYHELPSTEEQNWKRFILITEALEENQSHLILPTLELLKEIKFQEPLSCFWFILCKLIITHENSLVSNWGIIYVMNANISFLEDQIDIILNVLNSTCLYEIDHPVITSLMLKEFCRRNFAAIFSQLNNINWVSVPFYRMLEQIEKHVALLESEAFENNVIADKLKLQTMQMPAKITNIVIRTGVQILYSKILTHFAKHVKIASLFLSIENTYKMGSANDGLKILMPEECIARKQQTISDIEKTFSLAASNINSDYAPELSNIMEHLLNLVIMECKNSVELISRYLDLTTEILNKFRNNHKCAEIVESTIQRILENFSGSEGDLIKDLIIHKLVIYADNLDILKNLMIGKLLYGERMTKEQQIEMAVGSEIQLLYNKQANWILEIESRKRLRLRCARQLSYFENFSDLVDDLMEKISDMKNPRYFPNSLIHRMKLRCLQPVVFCSRISEKSFNILTNELLTINNQPNVTYLIEIIIAKNSLHFFEILKDVAKIQRLKAPALKSIFSIAIMQIRMCQDFKTAKQMLVELHDLIMPFTMGQNFGIRTYAQAAIVMAHQHVLMFCQGNESNEVFRIAKTCDIINESLKFKNAARYFDVVKRDFRFTMNMGKLWTADAFYEYIPRATKMTFEEIINVDVKSHEMATLEFITEMNTEQETDVVQDELLVPVVEQMSEESMNLQQKYLPYKYQIPGAKLMETMPSVFRNVLAGDQMKPRSNLTVVASLITRAPNLGGLARTCEIFGVENYVIESLKFAENSEFKALSKTAEKWIKMSEVKKWQLFDYLHGMKQKGYVIVGAEQSGKSISIMNAAIPKKCVLLLGDEKEGIPAAILALLDITIEIPQSGVLRSLNVHVTGAVLIWEYAKQHLF